MCTELAMFVDKVAINFCSLWSNLHDSCCVPAAWLSIYPCVHWASVSSLHDSLCAGYMTKHIHVCALCRLAAACMTLAVCWLHDWAYSCMHCADSAGCMTRCVQAVWLSIFMCVYCADCQQPGEDSQNTGHGRLLAGAWCAGRLRPIPAGARSPSFSDPYLHVRDS